MTFKSKKAGRNLKAKRQPLPEVKVGQVWVDCDWRQKGCREVKVLKVSAGRVTAEVVAVPASSFGKNRLGKKTEIAQRRFRPTSTGYRLKETAARPGLAPSVLETEAEKRERLQLPPDAIVPAGEPSVDTPPPEPSRPVDFSPPPEGVQPPPPMHVPPPPPGPNPLPGDTPMNEP